MITLPLYFSVHILSVGNCIKILTALIKPLISICKLINIHMQVNSTSLLNFKIYLTGSTDAFCRIFKYQSHYLLPQLTDPFLFHNGQLILSFELSETFINSFHFFPFSSYILSLSKMCYGTFS